MRKHVPKATSTPFVRHLHLSACLILFLLAAFSAKAHDFEAVNSDGVTIYYEITSDSTVSVTDAYDLCENIWSNGLSIYDYLYNGNVNIPSTVTYNENVYTVTAIGDYAFFGAGLFTGSFSVTMPSSVTSIGDYAFWSSAVSSISIPNSVTSIGNYAFYQCGLLSISIPNSVTSIGNGAFAICGNLSSISIPNSVTFIGDYAFCVCGNLSSISIPNSVTFIGDCALGYCRSLRNVVIASSCSLPNSLFYLPDTNWIYPIPDTVPFNIDNLTILSPNPPIVSRGINPITGMINTTFYGISNSTLIHVPCLAIGDYKSDMEWGKYSNYHGLGGEDTNLVRQACDKYIWLDGNTYTSDTIVSCTNPSICDSAATINLSLTVHNSPQRGTDTIFLCDKTLPYVYDADTLYAFGEYLLHYTVEDNSCDSIVDLMLIHRNLTDSTQLQMVTIEWGHCRLLWTPCEYASGYKIYREGIGSDPYELVYTAPADAELTWVDKESNPKSMVYRYKICAVDDSCGGKETRASYGASIHLMISNGANGSYNLQWTPYEGEMNYTAYNIYRGPDEENQELIATVPVSITSYSDYEASETEVFYSVTAVLTPREAKSSMEIRSNIVSPEWQLRATQGALIISYAEGSKLYIYDALGRLLKCIDRASAEERVEVPSSGLYIVQQEGGISKKITVLK